ncbi:MAG: hypothetical protein RLZZ436_1715, partial [Planctomycetota bacterium]
CPPLPAASAPLSGRAEAPGCVSAPWCPPLPAASAPLSGRAEAPGCDFGTLVPGDSCALTSHFSLLTSHFSLPCGALFYSLLSRAASCARRLPPNGIGFLVFRLLWRTLSPLKRFAPVMAGVRSLSIGRYRTWCALARAVTDRHRGIDIPRSPFPLFCGD